ncbi:hypothetical protein CYLTODRAFT_419252 [Cylindrobasidium torrendii FP15055 ss-10]|uniref:Extracellular metalloproteinase n=1 Tax=Cylindrobasidium torrendii FP15055 ss-10 TaxID=1314674 RepID=A0A0D7BN08_9AGAR|nr:hypothetical protein CYLTODRAFT_419252 [Cylindrobasidium torrendii FP15055 ss-10]
MLSSTLLPFVLVSMSFLMGTMAAPMPGTIKHRTHSTRHLKRSGTTVSTYHPTSSFKTKVNRDVESLGLAKRSDGEPLSMGEMATSFLSSELGVNVTYRTGSNKNSAISRHAFLTQSHDDVPFINAVANVQFTMGAADSLTGAPGAMKIASYAHSFVNCSSIAASTPSLEYSDAVSVAQDKTGGAYVNVTGLAGRSSLGYYVKEDQSAALTHVVQVKNNATGEWYETYIDAHSGELVGMTDYVAKASFRVPTFTAVDPTQDFELVKDPEDFAVSPLGWNSDGTQNFTDTEGNNAVSFKSLDANFQQLEPTEQSADGVFDFTPDLTQEPDAADANIDAARTNAFFVVNMMHDIYYRYGFTEDAFNFQQDNFDKGGAGADPVLISIQDPTGTDNAQFSTPADGQSGTMQMFLFTQTKPSRDGALENDVVIHEMTHGLTGRLTGGGTGRCLQTTESGGLGEGWSDAVADWVAQSVSETVEDYAVGAFVSGTDAGLRSAPYSTDQSVNALTYASVKKLNEVHNIGEVWAEMLHTVNSDLTTALGHSPDALTNANGTEGNVVFMQLLVDALQVQPCNPTFIDARDAWYQADETRYQGANKCTLQKSFASRGLGLKADASFTDDDTVDAECADGGAASGSASAGGASATAAGSASASASGAAASASASGTGRRVGRPHRHNHN